MQYDDPVGYGNPPRQSRFKKGQSGNPKGRPHGARNRNTPAKILKKVLDRPVRDAATGKEISTGEALLRSLRQLAIKGDQRAFERVLKFRTLRVEQIEEDALKRKESPSAREQMARMAGYDWDEETQSPIRRKEENDVGDE